MTAGQHIVANSTLFTGVAWDHLINPRGEGGGGTGDIIIADGILIDQEPLVVLTDYTDDIIIAAEPSTSVYIEENDIMVEIIEEEKDEVDVI